VASLRKRYQPQLGIPTRDDEPPVTSPPEVSGARLPEPVVDAGPPPEMLETKSPADVAASTALKARLAEMDRAEELARQQPQQPKHASEPQQQQPEMPAAVAEWLSRHPQYTDPNDRIAQAEIGLATMKCTRDGLTWNDDDFLPSIERHLGMRQQPQPNGNGVPKQNAASARPMTVDRPAPQRMSAPPVSAPPTREVPSYSTGRSPRYRAPLTKDELEIAAASGQTPEQYQAQKERMLRMKESGQMQ
jgi:hypothetical protein